jgi:hypothetical protein
MIGTETEMSTGRLQQVQQALDRSLSQVEMLEAMVIPLQSMVGQMSKLLSDAQHVLWKARNAHIVDGDGGGDGGGGGGDSMLSSSSSSSSNCDGSRNSSTTAVSATSSSSEEGRDAQEPSCYQCGNVDLANAVLILSSAIQAEPR